MVKNLKNPLGLGGVSFALLGATMLVSSQPAAAQEKNNFARMCHSLDSTRTEKVSSFGDSLHLSPNQKDAWERFQAATKNAAQPIRDNCAKLLGSRPPSHLPDRMAALASIEQAKYEALRRQADAVADLYRNLTPQQRDVADHLRGFGGEE